jgi:signal transduction histidine kinase
MRSLFSGKRGGALVFALITVLVIGGLGWLTVQALDMERTQDRAERHQAAAEQRLQREKDFDHRLQLALTLLDSRVLPALVQEESRPFEHYSSVFATSGPLTRVGGEWKRETVLEPSPLLSSDSPDWIVLHFQSLKDNTWKSPQIPSEKLRKDLAKVGMDLPSADPGRLQLRTQTLDELNCGLRPQELLAQVDRKSVWLESEEKAMLPGTANSLNNGLLNQQNFDQRYTQQVRVQGEAGNRSQQDPGTLMRNVGDQDWFTRGAVFPISGTTVPVQHGRMVYLWVKTCDGTDRLLGARKMSVANTVLCQGLVIDWPRLQSVLQAEVADSFPKASFAPLHEDEPRVPERTMSTLPILLDPGEIVADEAPPAATPLGWTPLRVGLGLTWAAALVALTAVGLGGWSLLSLSERRIRFVSAVTHELRTPLTTLRLYLDMLTGGMIKDDKTKQEYLETLDNETERLNRLIGNVLDFSRLENQQPRLNRSTVAVTELVQQVADVWKKRCEDAQKQLVIECQCPEDTLIETDTTLMHQVLGNLIDNASKYSREAADNRIWLRARLEGSQCLVLEVEDRGPGIPSAERRTVFHPFRRGHTADVTAGGVGLGLALARRWCRLLGARLRLVPTVDGTGACFRIEINHSC